MANAPELTAVTQELCPGRRRLTVQATDDPSKSISFECSTFPIPVTEDISVRATVQHFSDGATRVMCPMLGEFQRPNGQPTDRRGCTLNTGSDPVGIGAMRLFKATFPDFQGTVDQISTPVCLFMRDKFEGLLD